MVAVSCSVLAVVVVVSISCCGRLVVVDVFSSWLLTCLFLFTGQPKGTTSIFLGTKKPPKENNNHQKENNNKL